MKSNSILAHTSIERIAFELDPQIIHHIIYSQAGSLGKAIIELVMNSMDAGATVAMLTMTKDGFACSDNGHGFATRQDVLRYFGRFGTPHQEGDATYGRFRLGRGQIMAHASTVWKSNDWQMTVDTRTMGYGFDLEPLTISAPGCAITGLWYEPLSQVELMSAVQEVRDLVRYTTVKVELNGHIITRDPRTEKWDFQDEYAYYRVKQDGAVSISNQGILVRNDASQLWGAGGLIVSKMAIGLNVSRTEILRKTCPTWKAIAKQFGAMANEMASRLGDHRKTEARREKSANALLSGDLNSLDIYHKEEVITLLPGKRHVTMYEFLNKCRYSHNRQQGERFAVVENGFDVPRGEAIASQGIAVVVHPQTLERFGCYNGTDLVDSIARIHENLREVANKAGTHSWLINSIYVPTLVDFAILRDAFLERTMVISEKIALDKETRRAWTALRCCLEHYARLCTGGEGYRNGPVVARGGTKFQILLGESNTAKAWTDGKSYIAIDIKIVKRLKSEPLMAAATIFALVEHEVSHQGDSLDCGHDEAFWERYHDISIGMSAQRQRYIHIWLTKYTTSMENEGKKSTGRAWTERFLIDRAGSGRQKRGLPAMIEDVSADPVTLQPATAENMALIDTLNLELVSSGLCPPPPNWADVIERARLAQVAVADQLREEKARDKAYGDELDAWHHEEDQAERSRLAAILDIAESLIDNNALHWLRGSSDESVRELWPIKPWEEEDHGQDEHWLEDYDSQIDEANVASGYSRESVATDPRINLSEDCRHLVQEGETTWGLERNAAAAGFCRVEEYLKWRAAEQA